MNNFLKILGGISLFIGSLFGHHNATTTQNLGTFNPVQTQVFFLSGSGITANATSVLLTSMDYVNGAPLSMNDLGSIGYATIDPGNSKEEQVSFSNIIQNTNGTALLTGVIRGLAFNPGTQGCNGSSTLAVSHSGSAQFVLSNTACFYTQYAALSNNNTFTGTTTFSVPAIYSNSQSFSNPLQIPDIAYVTSVATSGAPDASQSAKGLVQIATPSQIASGTATSTDGSQTLWNVVAPSQYGKTYGVTPSVTTNSYGSATGTASNTVVLSFNYSGSIGSFNLPNATDSMGRTITAITTSSVVFTLNGAQGQGLGTAFGGANGTSTGGLGGQVIGTIPGPSTSTTYYYNVGSYTGYNGGGSGAGSGTGNQFSGAGGGMTWISTTSTYSNATVLAVAGGGGGNSSSAGGAAGGTTGSNGGNTSPNFNGAPGNGGSQSGGGTGGAGGSPNGTAGVNGSAGLGGSGGACFFNGSACSFGAGGGAGYFGGGGGGGGGYNGGNGQSAGGGGGSSFATSTLSATSTTGGVNSGNGTFSYTYTYTYTWSTGAENVTSTVSGTNYAGTVTVSATTTHLSPTTSTINFGTWTNNPTSISCLAQTWGSNLSPYLLAETTTSVEFGFGSTIAGNKYNYSCQTY